MRKKFFIIASITLFLTFIGLFLHFYKNYGGFRKSIASAWLVSLVFFSNSLESVAKDVNGFAPQGSGRPVERRGFFSQKFKNRSKELGKSKSGNGGDGDGKPKYIGPESIEDTNERLKHIQEFIRQWGENSDSEIECLQVDESYKSNSDLKKVTQNAYQNKKAMKNLEDVKEKLGQGENPMKIGYHTTSLGNGFYYTRKPDSRIIVKIDPITGNLDIVGFGLRSNEKNMKTLVTIVNSQFDTKIKINPKAY